MMDYQNEADECLQNFEDADSAMANDGDSEARTTGSFELPRNPPLE